MPALERCGGVATVGEVVQSRIPGLLAVDVVAVVGALAFLLLDVWLPPREMPG